MAFIHTDSFNALKNIIEGDIIVPSDPTYDESLKRWSRLAEKEAGAVIFVKTNQDVSKVIKYAVSNSIDLAIKGEALSYPIKRYWHLGGGHNPSGASSSEGGIVIDLSRYMTEVIMDIDAKSVRVGGGALWGDVDAVTSPASYGTVGGTVSHVSPALNTSPIKANDQTGVAGWVENTEVIKFQGWWSRLTLGGGIGNLSGRFGLTIDNIIDVTVVLADGRTVPASKDVNEDVSPTPDFGLEWSIEPIWPGSCSSEFEAEDAISAS
jgi:FAD/FMN-containing dehydrogenase